MSERISDHIRSNMWGITACFIAVMGITVVASASDEGPRATRSASATKQIKKLKRKDAQLEQRLAALEGKPIPTSLPPSGPASGVLDGTYPSPGLASNSVGATEIIDGNVGTAEIAPRAITGTKFFDSGVSSTDVAAVAGETCVNGPSFSVPGITGADHVIVAPPVGFPVAFTLTGVPDPGSNQVNTHICNHFIGGGSADPDGTGGAYKFLIIR